MWKFLLPFLLCLSLSGITQPGNTIKKGKQNSQNNDSTVNIPEKLKDSVFQSPGLDSIQNNDNIERNVGLILKMQKERKAREKKTAMIRIGIGIAFLIILIIGLRRKTKKKVER